MRELPEGLDESELVASLAGGWGLDVSSQRYAPIGFGSYHWVVEADGTRYFVTVDDLDQKSFLGATRGGAFAGLRSALDTAFELLQRHGLEFVVAPLPARNGEKVRRINERYSVAVFPFVRGTSGIFGERGTPQRRAELVRMLVRLHQVEPSAVPSARFVSRELAARSSLESALRDVNREWIGGPFSEPARALLARDADSVRRRLSVFDRLGEKVDAEEAAAVIAHGEPHAVNLIRRDRRLFLVDWDTAGLAPPERDLWMLDSSSGRELELYAQLSGRSLNRAALDLYRIRWNLDDIAVFMKLVRSRHVHSADTEKAMIGLASLLRSAVS